jgi:hypothetical protein
LSGEGHSSYLNMDSILGAVEEIKNKNDQKKDNPPITV